MNNEIRKVANVIADAMPADPESYALDPDGALARNNARDIIAALHAAGYEIVPKEPTDEMVRAGVPEYSPYGEMYAASCYREMLRAATRPTPPKESE